MTLEPAGPDHARAAAREPAGDARAAGRAARSARTSRRPVPRSRADAARSWRPGSRARWARTSPRSMAAGWCGGPSRPIDLPLDRRPAGRAAGPPAARRAARVHRHRDDGPRDRRRHARVPRRPRPLGGRRVLPDPAAAARPRRRARAARRDRRLGHAGRVARQLQRPGLRLAARSRRGSGSPGRAAPVHAGHLDLLPFVRRVFRHRMEDARLRTVEGELLGVSRIGDVEGWEIPSIYLDVLRGGPVDALAGVVIHNEKDVRSLGLLLAHVERRYADRAARHDAPRGDLAGLARAYGRGQRHEEALACLDDALASAPPVRDPFGRTPVAPALARERLEDERDAWWEPRIQPTFGGRPPRTGWRGPLANGRGGPLGPAPGRGRLGDGRHLGRRRPLDRRAARRRARAPAAAARPLDGGGRGLADGRRGGRRPGRDRLDRGRQAPRAPPARIRAGALAATRAAWRLLERLRGIGRAAPAPRGGPPAPRRAALGAAPRRGAAVRPGARPARRPLGRGGRPQHPAQHGVAGRHAEQPGPSQISDAAAAPTSRSASGPAPGPSRDGSTRAANTPARNVSPAPTGSTNRSTGIGDQGASREPPGRWPPRRTRCRRARRRSAASSRRVGAARASDASGVAGSMSSRPTPTRSARRDDRRRAGRMLGHRLAGDEDPEQALPAEGDQRAGATGRRPRRRAARPRRARTASRRRVAPGRRQRRGLDRVRRPAGRAGCARRASRC